MKGMKIGIDFGTSSLKIYAEGKGIVVDEPSIVAVEIETGRPIAFGRAADAVYGRNGDDIKIVKVIRNGVISDFVMAERMLRYYLQRVCGNRIYKPNIILSLSYCFIESHFLFSNTESVISNICSKKCAS